MNTKQLTLIPLGGMGEVTQNMFVYEYGNEILIVDCGIGFPDVYMPGVDAIIPDISYLLKQLQQGKKIVGLLLSHGHDDHIAALPYLLPELPKFPIYASPLAAGFAAERMDDAGVKRDIQVMPNKKVQKLSNNFSFEFFAVTHSVPDTRHILIQTPVGNIYHGSDFKLDPHPVDGVLTDFEHITQLGKKGILLMLMDCLRVERQKWTKSESTTGPVIAQEMQTTKGKFVVTLMSSHIHRIQQVVDAAAQHQRKVAFVGRSVEQNVRIAGQLKKLKLPKSVVIDKRDLGKYPDHQLCVIIAGSQGQEGSSLVRAVYDEHRIVQINKNDKVVFSADAIPGNEVPYFKAVDELCRNDVEVIYPDVNPNVHQSGHASSVEQQELLSLVKPQLVMPIGGADRHRTKFWELVAKPLNIPEKQVLRPKTGQVMAFNQQGYQGVVKKVTLNPKTIDGLGIGDVGPIVLSDRRSLSQAGIVVVVIPRSKGRWLFKEIMVVSRGFVFMREADEVIKFIKDHTTKIIKKAGKKTPEHELKRLIERRLGRKLYKVIKREPMIVPVIMETGHHQGKRKH
ncbi:MAG: RNase J family beta-CASP ribonuclease [Candidatus Pacebacteria bacterium]|nr:RNase J family beta-CASP ribonuclease [Candidatus Paceibacterota bacterium]